MARAKAIQRERGLALPLVLVFATVIGLLAVAALRGSALEARTAAHAREAARAWNFAETALELLLRRVAVRWTTGGEHCAVDRYCAGDFPAVAALLERAPAAWTVAASLRDGPLRPPARGTLASVSSVRFYVPRVLEAVVTIEGPAPVALAAGLALPLTQPTGDPP